ncbi:hypothetical protein PSPO01_15943 [Paraphaeosphaeria sporulosa]
MSLLFTAPACLPSPGITIVIVPFCELLRDLKNRLAEADIQAIKWLPGCYGCFDDHNKRENLRH